MRLGIRPRRCASLVVGQIALIVRRASWALAVGFVLTPDTALADGQTVTVHAVPRADLRTGRSGEWTWVRGTLLDDTDAPLARTTVTVDIRAEQLSAVDGCDGFPMVRHPTGAWGMETNGRGEMCLRLRAQPGRLSVVVRAPESSFREALEATLEAEVGRTVVRLAFDPPPSELDVDGPATEVHVVAAEADDEEAPLVPLREAWLTLMTETAARIATARTDTEGQARFRFDATDAGPLGPGWLRVQFAGDEKRLPAEVTATVVRRARVDLRFDRQTYSSDGQGAVSINAFYINSSVASRGTAPPSGVVTFALGNVSLGAVRLDGGQGFWSGRLPPRTTDRVPIRARYVPDVAWLQPARPDHEVTLTAEPPSLLQRAGAWLAAAVGLALWLAARIRGPQISRTPERARGAIAEESGQPGIELVGPPAADGFEGTVTDAHDGSPIADAEVAWHRPSFEGVRVMASTRTDASGSFRLTCPGESVRTDDRLHAEGHFHAAIQSPAPRGGRVQVRLVARKRALLDELVAWVRRSAVAVASRQPQNPTPAELRQGARGFVEPAAVAQWAEDVEAAAYGAEPVDRPRHEAMAARAPQWLPAGAPDDPRGGRPVSGPLSGTESSLGRTIVDDDAGGDRGPAPARRRGG